jgi:hypothetical protein
MFMRHDIDSLEALLASLAWRRAKRRARQWAIVVPFLALPILLPCLELYRQMPVKAESQTVVGPWMLPVKAEPPVVVGPWMLPTGPSHI